MTASDRPPSAAACACEPVVEVAAHGDAPSGALFDLFAHEHAIANGLPLPSERDDHAEHLVQAVDTKDRQVRATATASPLPDGHDSRSPLWGLDHGGRSGARECVEPETWASCSATPGSDLCNPKGPPYSPKCHIEPGQAGYFYLHENRTLRGVTLDEMVTAPFRQVALLSNGVGGGTATLIARAPSPPPELGAGLRSFFLTAAHNVIRISVHPVANTMVWDWRPLTIELARRASVRPYGTVAAQRVWVPVEYLYGFLSGSTTVDVRAYDYAIVECDDVGPVPSTPLPDPPHPSSMYASEVFSVYIWDRPALTVGYACGRGPDPATAGGLGVCRTEGVQYYTDPWNAQDGVLPPHAGFTGILWDTQHRGGAVLESTVEGTTGMSGGPMLFKLPNASWTTIGVLVGSPCECGTRTAETNWSVALTQNTKERIGDVIQTGTHKVGASGVDMIPNYL